MSDVEWYLESAGVRRGPFSARQIIDMMNGGEVARDALVTTARMQGDWVTVGDLAEAYAELNQKKSSPARPVESRSGGASTVSHPRGEFQAPPRPMEQLEASKLITLPQDGSDMDATESLFSAVQAIREKKHAAGPSRDRTGESNRTSRMDALGGRVSPQGALMGALAVVILILVYGVIQILHKDESAPETKPVAEEKHTAPPTGSAPVAPPATPTSSRLLSEGSATPTVRTAPPIGRTVSRPGRVEGYRRAPAPPPPEMDRPAEPESQPEQPPDNETNPPPHNAAPPGPPEGAPGAENANPNPPPAEGAVAPEDASN